MRRALEPTVFVGLAAAVHLGVFAALSSGAGGATSSGAGGTELVSLEAADAALAELVAEWDRPPEAAREPESALPEPPTETPPPPPVADLPPVVAPQMALSLPDAPDLAVALPKQPAPPPPPEPEPKPEPVAKPEPPQPKPAAKRAPAPKKPARQASAAAPAQRAAGSGGGAMAGDQGQAAAATLSQSRVKDLKASWGAAIRARIERRKAYPKAAAGAKGKVTVRLAVARGGTLASVSVVKSSGHPALDGAALEAVRAAGRFPAAPDGLDAASYTFTLPMTFSR